MCGGRSSTCLRQRVNVVVWFHNTESPRFSLNSVRFAARCGADGCGRTWKTMCVAHVVGLGFPSFFVCCALRILCGLCCLMPRMFRITYQHRLSGATRWASFARDKKQIKVFMLYCSMICHVSGLKIERVWTVSLCALGWLYTVSSNPFDRNSSRNHSEPVTLY